MFLAIPGPTTMPDQVLSAMHRPAIDIYSQEMVDLTNSLLDDLSRLFATTGRSYIYIANGHGAWEAALSNVLSRGDRVLVLESGRFAAKWGVAAGLMGAETEILPGSWQSAVSVEALEMRLRADSSHRIKAILVAQVDTASGVCNDVEAIGRAIRAAQHPALYMVDAVASLGCIPFAMDEWGIDVAVAASQKGLMTPPGLGFVAAGGRALAAHHNASLRTPYWDWSDRDSDQHYNKYGGTAPVHLLFALRRALDMIAEEGIDNVLRRHRLLAQATRHAIAAWAHKDGIGFNIKEPDQRSDTVTTITLAAPHDPNRLRDYCRDRCGVILGTGLGDIQHNTFRIAHMGHINAPMALGTLAVIETALKALKIPHGTGGTEAAISYLAEMVHA